MNSFLKKALAVAAITGISTGAFAHRIWILPSTFTLSGEKELVTVDGAISNDLFFPNHVAIDPANIHVTAPGGKKVPISNASQGAIRATFDVKLETQGTYKIAEIAETYFARWTEDGKPRRARNTLEGLFARGLKEKDDVAFSVSERRVETFVTLGAPSTDIFTPTGKGIELTPVTHPNDVYVGEDVSFAFTVDGKPAADLEVTILKGHDRYRDTTDETKVKTDADGKITFKVAEPGRYWLSLATRAGTRSEKGLTMPRRVSYTATFEALSN